MRHHDDVAGPPDTKSSETREAILSGARNLFGERGYGSVTNKDLAAAAGGDHRSSLPLRGVKA